MRRSPSDIVRNSQSRGPESEYQDPVNGKLPAEPGGCIRTTSSARGVVSIGQCQSPPAADALAHQ